MSHKISLLLLSLTLVLIYPSNAQNSPQDYVNARNTARSAIPVPNMVWDTTLASYVQNYSNSHIKLLVTATLSTLAGPYGENLAKGSGSFMRIAAVKLWVAEKKYYDYMSNTCVGGARGHYTQVVWNTSIVLGALGFNALMGGIGSSVAIIYRQLCRKTPY